MLTRFIIGLALLLISFAATHAQNNVTADISHFAIIGWWSDCSFELDTSCAGTYQEYEPAPLDPTGNTCYVNPHADPTSTTSTVVFWLGPAGSNNNDTNSVSSTSIYLYTLRVPDSNVDRYMPTNCTDSGACSCDNVDPLREPWKTTGSCSGDCSSTIANNLGRLDEDCAVLFKTRVVNAFFNDTIVTCAIQGKLIDTSTSSPTASPSPTYKEEPSTDESTSSGSEMKASVSLMGFLAAGTVLTFLRV